MSTEIENIRQVVLTRFGDYAQRHLRADGWLNAILGFGGARDKLSATQYGACFEVLSPPVLTAMYHTEDMAAKIVDVYPREALREGFKLTGADDQETDVADFLRPYEVLPRFMSTAIWGRLYGGAAIWLGSYTANPETPFEPGEKIDFLRILDKRWIEFTGRTEDVDASGEPNYFQIQRPEGDKPVVPRIHKSRLVLLPGALTDSDTKRNLNYWDLSVLQRPYNALKSDGEVWANTRQLVSVASIGVTKIKGLWAMVTGGPGNAERITERVRLASMAAGVARDKVLDADGEDYTRVNTTFSGLAELSEKAIQRVAAAAEIPVTVLLGQAPAGLNATGDSDLRWFLARVNAYRVHTLEPRLVQLLTAILAQPDSPVQTEALAGEIGLAWPDLWPPTALERSQVYSANSSADAALVGAGILLAEEVALARFGVDGYGSEMTLTEDQRKLREEALAIASDNMIEALENPPEVVPPGEDPADAEAEADEPPAAA